MCSIKNREKNVTLSATNPYVQDLGESARILCLARCPEFVPQIVRKRDINGMTHALLFYYTIFTIL